MIAHYSSLAKRFGGNITGQYRNAICFVWDHNHCFSSMDQAIATEPFILSAIPHPRRVEGFPLDSLSIDIASGQYYYDLGGLKELHSSVENGVEIFFKKVLSEIEKQ